MLGNIGKTRVAVRETIGEIWIIAKLPSVARTRSVPALTALQLLPDHQTRQERPDEGADKKKHSPKAYQHWRDPGIGNASGFGNRGRRKNPALNPFNAKPGSEVDGHDKSRRSGRQLACAMELLPRQHRA